MSVGRNRFDDVTLPELESQLEVLAPGTAFVLSFDIFGDIFPPGEPDTDSRKDCYAVANRHGCEMSRHEEAQTISFIKR